MQTPNVRPMSLVVAFAAVCAGPAWAQSIDTFLPANVAGRDVEPGVTVLSRLRPDYDAKGLHIDNWVLSPTLTESAGENTNVQGYSTGSASAFIDTKATANLASQWLGDHFAADMLVEDVAYLQQAHQSYTNWTTTLSATHDWGEDSATVAYSHLYLHQIASDFGALQADAPVAYQVDDLRAFTNLALSRFTLTPEIDLQYVRDDNASILGIPVSLDNQTRVIVTAGAELRYALTDQRALVVVGQAIETDYTQHLENQPSETSTSGRLLAGFDTTARGMWRARLLAGVEVRSFEAAQYATRWAPIIEGSLIWTPNGMTTATIALTRTIADPADNGVQGYTLSKANFTLDRELRRNLLGQVSLGFQYADPLQTGASQTNWLAGVSLTRLVNRRVRIVLSYDFDAQRGSDVILSAGSGFPAALRGGNYDRHFVQVSLRLAL